MINVNIYYFYYCPILRVHFLQQFGLEKHSIIKMLGSMVVEIKATNTFRVLGEKDAGIPVLLMDVFKGWISVNYIIFVSNGCNPFTEKVTYHNLRFS